MPGPAGVKPLLLMSHADVVPAVAADWTHPPFNADLTDGFVWARGAIDNKAHGIMALMTMLALKRNGVALKRGVEMMVNPDEEAGGENGADWMVENHWDAIDPAFAFNEGGEGTPDWLGSSGHHFPGRGLGETRDVAAAHRPRQGRARFGAEGRQPQSHSDQRAASTAREAAADPNHANLRRRDGIDRAAVEPSPASFELAHLDLARDR